MKREQIITIFAVAIGGAMGTLIRYLIYLQTLATSFPFGTLVVNVVGSLLLGFVTGWILHKRLNDSLRIGFGVGFCGGFTTMSTLAADVLNLYMNNTPLFVAFYMSLTIFGGLLSAFTGYFLGDKISFYFRFSPKDGEVD